MHRWSDCFDELPSELQQALQTDDITHHPDDMEDFNLCLAEHQGLPWCTAASESVPKGQSLSLCEYTRHLRQLSHAANFTKKARLEVRHPSIMRALDYSFRQLPLSQWHLTEHANTAMKRWRHWKPHHTQHLPPTTQRQIELNMHAQWTKRLLTHLTPRWKVFPYMLNYAGPTQETLWSQLFGASRFGTIKLHTLTYEKVIRIEPDILPFENLNYAAFLNTLETNKTSTSNVRRMWRTTHWLSIQTGLTSPQSDSSMKAIFESTCNRLITTVYHEQQRAFPPHMDVIHALERATATGTTADRYAAGIFRFQLGSSGRFNDLMHAAMNRLRFLTETTEAPMWQTKTDTIDNNSKIIPLISPNHSFTGILWWNNLENIMKNILKDESFKNADYLLATPDKTRTRILPQPITYGKALTWLRAILHTQQVDAQHINRTTLHSLRLWMAEAAFQHNIPREQRRYIGRWANENTADVYTRDHRLVINNIWKAVTRNMSTITIRTDYEVPAETTDTHYELEDEPHDLTTEEPQPTEQTMPARSNLVNVENYPRAKGGPLSLVINKGATGKINTRKAHFIKTNGQSVGCGFYPKSDKIIHINNAEDCLREFSGTTSNITMCKDCTKFERLAASWLTNNNYSTSSSGSSDTSDSENDTDSENEAMDFSLPTKDT